MTYCEHPPRSHLNAYPSPALSSAGYPNWNMADWQQQIPEDDSQHPFNFLTPIGTQQEIQNFDLPPQHVLDYLSPPMPPSPYTPQSAHSPTPPSLGREDSFASPYAPSQAYYVPSQGQSQVAQPYHLNLHQQLQEMPAPQILYTNEGPATLSPPPPQRNRRVRSRGRAVCIGINYFNQKGEMKGRVDEARNLSNYLQQVKHYTAESIILLTDDQNSAWSQPTKQNILSALHWLGEHTYEGERLVLYYSGHGKVPAVGKKSRSAKNKQVQQDEIETIYPVDFRSFKEGMIKPEELEALLEPVRRKGAKLTLIIDTHAGVASKDEEKAVPTQ